MSTKKRILVTLIVAVLVGIVIFPMLPLEYREASAFFCAHRVYSGGLGYWLEVACALPSRGGWGSNREPHPLTQRTPSPQSTCQWHSVCSSTASASSSSIIATLASFEFRAT